MQTDKERVVWEERKKRKNNEKKPREVSDKLETGEIG